MTRKEFEALRSEIQKQQLKVDSGCDPFSFALRRAAARQEQLKTLIAAARTVKGSKTVDRKIERWQRQLIHLQDMPKRFSR
jgi:hypothetical protein